MQFTVPSPCGSRGEEGRWLSSRVAHSRAARVGNTMMKSIRHLDRRRHRQASERAASLLPHQIQRRFCLSGSVYICANLATASHLWRLWFRSLFQPLFIARRSRMTEYGRPKTHAFRNLPPAFPFRVPRVFRGLRAPCGGRQRYASRRSTTFHANAYRNEPVPISASLSAYCRARNRLLAASSLSDILRTVGRYAADFAFQPLA